MEKHDKVTLKMYMENFCNFIFMLPYTWQYEEPFSSSILCACGPQLQGFEFLSSFPRIPHPQIDQKPNPMLLLELSVLFKKKPTVSSRYSELLLERQQKIMQLYATVERFG